MTITASAALLAHLSGFAQTTATLFLVTLKNGTVLGFTDHDSPIQFPPGASAVNYVALVGYTKTDIATSAALDVDNLEIDGILSSPSITQTDLASGLWDFAQIQLSLVNYKDLTQGQLIYRVGTIGEVTLERNNFKAELRGKTQAYTRVIGQLTSPSCRTTLGSKLCTVNLAPLTFTGTVTGVLADNRTVMDTSLTQPGPSGGIAIIGVTNANPGVVTLASPLGLPTGSPVTIAAVMGMTNINTTTVAYNPSGNTFQLPEDTSLFPTYTGGGTVTPLGSNSGYFDNGIVIWLTGNNAGKSMEIQSYVPGQFILEIPMFGLIQVGDTYTISAGCDYSFNTCMTRFSNGINFQGEPYIPGQDKIVQIGKQ